MFLNVNFIQNLIFLVVLSGGSVFSQHEFHRTWTGSPASNPNHVGGNPLGGYVVVSEHTDSNGLYFDGMTISSYDACDVLKWSKNFFEKDAMIIPAEMIVTKKGEVLVTGSYQDTQGDIFLLKADDKGVVKFFKRYGSPESEYTYSTGELKDGGYFIYGNSTDGLNTFPNFILKINEDGNIVWSKSYFDQPIWGWAIATSDGGILTRTGNLHYKVDKDGKLVWAKNYEDFKGYYASYPVEVSGGYVYARYSNFNVFDTTSHLFKIDYNGNLVWTGEYFTGAYVNRVIQQDNGHFIALCNNYQSGGSTSISTLVELDENGKVLRKSEKTSPAGFQYRCYDMAGLPGGDVLISGIEEGLTDPTSFLYYSRTGSDLDFGACSDVSNLKSSVTGTISGTDTSVFSGTLNFYEKDLTAVAEVTDLKEITVCEMVHEFAIDLGNDTTLCPGISMELTSPANYPVYNWSTGENTKSILVNETGIYILTVGNGCENTSDTIQISYYPTTEPEFKISKNQVTPFESVLFTSLNKGLEVYWTYGSDTSTQSQFEHVFQENGIYPVLYRIKDANGCYFEKSSEISVRLVTVFIPKAITPNGDGVNDEFGPIGFGIDNFKIRIYTRNGELIFEEENRNWNGDYKSRDVPVSGFAFEIEVTDEFNEVQVHKGIVYILK